MPAPPGSNGGEPGLPGRTVHLWELIGEEWTQVEDLDGRAHVATDDEGGYAFVVSPTNYDEHAPGGEAVLFAVGGQPVCFFTPQGGI